jgi:hypothetical protein
MITSSRQASIKVFILETFRNALLVIAGFAIAPTHLLYSFYEAHTLFRGLAISVGILTAIWGLFNMLKISLRVIEARTVPAQ